MFDILVYLFESYIHADACPEGELLNRKLSAAGFEQALAAYDFPAALACLRSRKP